MKPRPGILLMSLLLAASSRLLAQSNAPANLRQTAVTANQVDLAWDDKSTNEARFEIERLGLTGSFIKIGEANANTPSYQDKTVTSLNTYSYRVRAIFATNASVYSNTLTVTTPQEPPGTPTGLTATLQGGSVLVKWDNGAGGTATSYRVERAVQGGAYSLYQTVAYSRTPSLTDNGVQGGQQYCYRVQATSGGGSSGFAGPACQLIPLVPTNVKNLQATPVNSSSIKVSWTPYGKESGITIERRKGQTGNFDKIKDWLADSGEFTDTGLEANTDYCYRIGESGHDYSTVVCATTQQSAPRAPARLTATPVSSSQIDLQWADLSNNETSFQLDRSTDGGQSFTRLRDVDSNTMMYSDRDVAGNTRYCYRIRAVNNVGASDYTDPPACATTPAPPAGVPQNLIATALSTTQIGLTWSTVAGASGYQLERSPNGNDNWTNIGNPPASATHFTDESRTPNTRYYYRLRAVNNAGVPGDFSTVVNAITPDVPPTAPTQLTITAVAYNQISLQWTDQSTNESGFELDRSPDGSTWSKLADLPGNTMSYTDQTVQPQTHYYYRIRAVNAAGPSGNSNPVDATTPVGPPVAPQDLTATAVSTTQISLSWGTIANATTILIERSPNGSTDWTQINTVPGNTTSYTDPNLTQNTRYYYRIKPTNTSGSGRYSNVADATTPDVPPVAPGGLSVTVISPTQLNLSWNDLSTNESGFEIERSNQATGGFTKVADLSANTKTYEDKSLTDNTAYCYRIRAKNAAGPSAFTDPVCATTPLAPPANPTNLMAQVFDYDQIRLTWAALGATAVTILIERSKDPNSGFVEIKQQPASQTTYIDMGLQEFTTYYYRIKAVNAAGSSAYSNVATARVEEVIIAVEDELETHTTLFVSQRSLHVITNWFTTAQTTLQLQAANGQLVLTENRKVRPADRWAYDLNSLPTGLYIITIVADGRKLAKRILLP